MPLSLEKIFVLDAIRSNRRRIALGVLIFFLVVLLEVALISFLITLNDESDHRDKHSQPQEPRGADFFLAVFFVALGITVVLVPFFWMWAYFWGKKALLRLFKLTEPCEADQRKLELAMEGVSIATGLKKPEVKVIDYDGVNAISLARGRKDALILITRGAAENLDRGELEALLAHELYHVMSHDTWLWILGLGMAIFLPFVMALNAGAVWRHFEDVEWISDLKPSKLRDMLFFGLIVGIFWVPLWLAFDLLILPRGRDQLADAQTVMITRDPEAMASLIRKSDIMRSESIPFVSLFINHMFFHQPLEPSGRFARNIYDLFDRHSEASEREALVNAIGQ